MNVKLATGKQALNRRMGSEKDTGLLQRQGALFLYFACITLEN